MRVRNSWLIAGSIVLVRMASIMRPPLSSSVHRLATSFTTASSYVTGIFRVAEMRFWMRPNCRRMMFSIIVGPSG